LVIPGGETLIFTAGLLVSTEVLHVDIVAFLALLAAAGFIGDCSGFYIGRKFGSKLYERNDTWYFKKKYLKAVEDFFKRYKKSTIILGKFLPVIRPFTPVTAGISKMKIPYFAALSAAAVIIYMSAFLLAGYFLGNRFPEIKNYLHWVLPVSIVVLVVPVVWKLRNKVKHTK